MSPVVFNDLVQPGDLGGTCKLPPAKLTVVKMPVHLKINTLTTIKLIYFPTEVTVRIKASVWRSRRHGAGLTEL